MRDMVRACQLDCIIGYKNDSNRLTRPKDVAKTILATLRELEPPTRFLIKPDGGSGGSSNKKRKRSSTSNAPEAKVKSETDEKKKDGKDSTNKDNSGWVEELDDGIILNKLMQQLRDGAPSIRRCLKHCYNYDATAFREFFEDPDNLEQTKRPYRCPNCEKFEY